MDYNKAALELHSKFPGKIAVQSLCECKDRDALSTAYTPGVAEPCRKIKANPDDVYTYTMKGRTVAVVTNGTAVLGLGNIGPEAGLPVMEGKCVLFKEFGGVDAFPICLNAKTKEEVIAAVKAIAPTFGGINLEDIRSPECFEIEAELERDLDIPVFHDDQHGTAIIVLAGVLNALKVVGKRIEDVKIVQNGPGAAGTAIIHMLQVAGAKNIVAVDEHGILYPNRPAGLEGHKGRLAEETNPDKLTGGLAEAIRDADIFIGTSIAGALTPELAATMAKDAIVFAMANPTPEIMPDLAKQAGVRVIGTGRSDFPNQVNNVLAFPGIFKGALSVRARDINPAMKMAAAKAIAGLIPDDELNEENILPKAFDPRVADVVAAAVAQAARESGVTEHIRYTGPLDAAAMRQAYLEADAFLLPSGCENSPNSLGEAMLLGLPCVASAVGGIPSMLANGTEGLLYGDALDADALARAVLQVLHSPDGGTAMGRAARARALQTHDAARNAADLLHIYESILQEEHP